MHFLRIWILDDDEDFLLLIDKWLKKNYDCEVTSFNTVESFDQELYRVNLVPDLILMDIRLKDANGLKVANEVHSLFQNVPIIHLTNLDGEPIIEEKYTILGKPINDKLLKSSISRLIKESYQKAL